jgi:hypothetical protein
LRHIWYQARDKKYVKGARFKAGRDSESGGTQDDAAQWEEGAGAEMIGMAETDIGGAAPAHVSFAARDVHHEDRAPGWVPLDDPEETKRLFRYQEWLRGNLITVGRRRRGYYYFKPVGPRSAHLHTLLCACGVRAMTAEECQDRDPHAAYPWKSSWIEADVKPLTCRSWATTKVDEEKDRRMAAHARTVEKWGAIPHPEAYQSPDRELKDGWLVMMDKGEWKTPDSRVGWIAMGESSLMWRLVRTPPAAPVNMGLVMTPKEVSQERARRLSEVGSRTAQG